MVQPVTDILVLCTANMCRSPMAQALLARELAAAGAAGSVRSAGLLRDGEQPPPEVISAMAAYRLDVSAHRSHVVKAADLSAADLVLAMARAQVRHAVITAPEAWPRAFTLKELVRRGQQVGPRPPGQPVASWLARIHDGRDRSALLGDSQADDVADPIGGPPQAYAATAGLLDQLISRLVELCWGRIRHCA
jgi:protein-tyrosine phosphatase